MSDGGISDVKKKSSGNKSLNCMDVKRVTRGKCIEILIMLVFCCNNEVINFLKILIYMYIKQTNNRKSENILN